MTVRDVVKTLHGASWTFTDGANHLLAHSPDGTRKVAIPRHPGDIKTGTLKAISKQTGVQL